MAFIDKRRNYVIVLDTETCNSYKDGKGKDVLDDSLVYDIGWQVIDTKGRVYERFSYCVKEIFVNEKELMNSCYYAEKLPSYWEDIWAGKRIIENFMKIRKIFFDCVKFYNVKAVCMHNARFDVSVLNNTIRYITKSRYRFFLPYGIEVWDSLKCARQVVANTATYRKFCETNGYMTKHRKPQVRLTAEILYRYISGNNDFVEAHQGLQDVEIESVILVYCIKKHKKMDKVLYHSAA